MFGISEFDGKSFSSFINAPKEKALDLSHCTLLEIIDERIKIKSVIYPKAYKRYSTLKKQIGYLQESYGCTIMPYQVNELFWNYFISYMINVSGLRPSSVKTTVSILKTTLLWATRYNCEISPTFDSVSIPKYYDDQLALTPDEVSHIYHFNLDAIKLRKDHREKLKTVRDHFVLSCSLGQRFSDMIRIDKSCFDRNKFSIMQLKTGNRCIMDIDKMAMDSKTIYSILEKYDYNAPVTTDVSCYNKYLKEILRYIGEEFNKEIKKETKVNGMIQTEFFPKWKLVTSHTCRRTFVTVNLLRGVNQAELMRASGHKTYGAFYRYVCFSND